MHQKLYPSKTAEAKAAFVAGCLHDVGKIDPAFQGWVIKDKNKNYLSEDGQHIDDAGKFSFENHPRHNEISCLIYELLNSPSLKAISKWNKPSIRHAIYWHHAKPFRTKGVFDTYGDIFNPLDKSLKGKAWDTVVLGSINLLESVCQIESEYTGTDMSLLSNCFMKETDQELLINCEKTPLPAYKEYKSSNEQLDYYERASRTNAKNNEIRACLITADRWVSSLSAQQLSYHITHKKLEQFTKDKLEEHLMAESNLVSQITDCLSRFPKTDRTKKQIEVAAQLANNNEHVGVLAGAAGCGKTKIALEWAGLGKAQQIFWICPRVQICQGLFTELTSDEYLAQTNVEIYTGEYKYTNSYQSATPEKDYFTGDIVITTIDQILSSVISHTKADRLLNYLRAHVVFDEFHEYINMPAFNLLFSELVASKRELADGAKTLLVSATPHYAYLQSLLDIPEYDVAEMPSFNPARYQFDFQIYDEKQLDSTNPLYRSQKSTTFVISNTATTAQKSFIKNQHDENGVLLHSKYKKSDKKYLFDSVYQAFKREGNREFDILRSGPIVQASLNISCDFMVSEITTAENCLQRLGRLDRFGTNNKGVNKYIIAVPETLHQGKRIGALAGNLSRNKCLSSTIAWYQYLLDATDQGQKSLLLAEIYQRNCY